MVLDLSLDPPPMFRERADSIIIGHMQSSSSRRFMTQADNLRLAVVVTCYRVEQQLAAVLSAIAPMFSGSTA